MNIFYNHFFSKFQSSSSPDFSVYFTIISFQILKFYGLFIIFYNHFFSNPRILRAFQYLLQTFLFKSSNSPDFPISFTIISFQIFKFSGLFSIFYNHLFSNPQILRTFQYLLQSFLFQSLNSPDFSVSLKIISSPILKFSRHFSIFYNHFFSNLQILRTFQYLLQSFPLQSSNSPDFSVSVTIISSQIPKFSGLFSIFYNHFFSNLQILRTFEYLLQSFPFQSSESPAFSVSFTIISSPILKFSGLCNIFYNHFLSNPQKFRPFQYLLQSLLIKSSNSSAFSVSFTIISFQILNFSGLFNIFYNHFFSNLQILRTFQYFFQAFWCGGRRPL